MEYGWIKLHRAIRKDPIYKIPVALSVWLECLLRATHEPGVFFLKRQKRLLQSGQFAMGRDEFGASIGVPGSTAWFWLHQFQVDSKIDIEKTTSGSIVTIINWHEYQKVDSKIDNRRTAAGQRLNTNKKEKTEKNENNNTPNDEFNEILKFFNETCSTSLLATEPKKTSFRARRVVWSMEQIKQAIKNRSVDDWAIREGWTGDWVSMFRNDDKIEHWLNRPNEIRPPPTKYIKLPPNPIFNPPQHEPTEL